MIAVVWATFTSEDEAARIGGAMVEAELAACVTLMPGARTLYRIKGAMREDRETSALFNTSAEKADALMEAIRAAHRVDLLAIAAWQAQAHDPYAEWVAAATRG